MECIQYKVIVRDRETGEEKYIEGLDKTNAEKEALLQAKNDSKLVYISWADEDGRNGYLNIDGMTEKCPGEPW